MTFFILHSLGTEVNYCIYECVSATFVVFYTGDNDTLYLLNGTFVYEMIVEIIVKWFILVFVITL